METDRYALCHQKQPMVSRAKGWNRHWFTFLVIGLPVVCVRSAFNLPCLLKGPAAFQDWLIENPSIVESLVHYKRTLWQFLRSTLTCPNSAAWWRFCYEINNSALTGGGCMFSPCYIYPYNPSLYVHSTFCALRRVQVKWRWKITLASRADNWLWLVCTNLEINMGKIFVGMLVYGTYIVPIFCCF